MTVCSMIQNPRSSWWIAELVTCLLSTNPVQAPLICDDGAKSLKSVRTGSSLSKRVFSNIITILIFILITLIETCVDKMKFNKKIQPSKSKTTTNRRSLTFGKTIDCFYYLRISFKCRHLPTITDESNLDTQAQMSNLSNKFKRPILVRIYTI